MNGDGLDSNNQGVATTIGDRMGMWEIQAGPKARENFSRLLEMMAQSRKRKRRETIAASIRNKAAGFFVCRKCSTLTPYEDGAQRGKYWHCTCCNEEMGEFKPRGKRK